MSCGQLEHEMGHMGIRHVTIQLETGDDCVGELCGDEIPTRREHWVDHSHHGHAQLAVPIRGGLRLVGGLVYICASWGQAEGLTNWAGLLEDP